jgi:hypothetical protein
MPIVPVIPGHPQGEPGMTAREACAGAQQTPKPLIYLQNGLDRAFPVAIC